MFYSCEDNSLQEAQINLTEHIQQNPSEISANAKLTAEIIGQFANDKDVQQELLNFATVEHNFEVSAKFSDLLNSDNSSGRSNLKFASKFREHLHKTGARFDIDIEQYLIDNNFILYAPYFAEYHKDTDLPITMSWHNGIDTTGFTEGFIVNTSGRSSALQINDDYAINKPTFVIMPDDDDPDPEDPEDPTAFDCYENPYSADCLSFCRKYPEECPDGSGGITYLPRDIDCRFIKEDDILRLTMPEVRLTGNTRTWPYRNYLYLFVMNGDFTVSNGLIQSSPNVNEVMYDFQVSRRNASNRNWINPGITFLLSNWKESISELRIAAAHKKSGGKDFTFKGEVGISTDGDETKSNLKVSYETRKVEKSEVMFNVGLDRCAELAFNASDMGFGKRDGYGIYRFDQLEFYLKVEFR